MKNPSAVWRTAPSAAQEVTEQKLFTHSLIINVISLPLTSSYDIITAVVYVTKHTLFQFTLIKLQTCTNKYDQQETNKTLFTSTNEIYMNIIMMIV